MNLSIHIHIYIYICVCATARTYIEKVTGFTDGKLDKTSLICKCESVIVTAMCVVDKLVRKLMSSQLQ